jgi:hypothetical protein
VLNVCVSVNETDVLSMDCSVYSLCKCASVVHHHGLTASVGTAFVYFLQYLFSMLHNAVPSAGIANLTHSYGTALVIFFDTYFLCYIMLYQVQALLISHLELVLPWLFSSILIFFVT